MPDSLPGTKQVIHKTKPLTYRVSFLPWQGDLTLPLLFTDERTETEKLASNNTVGANEDQALT